MDQSGSVRDKIVSVLPDLRGGHRKIAKVLLEKPENAFLPANALAAELGISPASFVRFAKRMGFSGYLQLRKELAGELRAEKISAGSAARARLTPPDAILRAEAEALARMDEGYNHSSLQKMSDLLSRAGRIIVAGYGLPGKFALILSDYLRMTGLKADPVTNSKFELFDELSHLGKGDALVIIDHGRYVKDLVHAVEVAEKWGVIVGVITDTEVSPLAQKANISLFFNLVQHKHIYGHSQLIVLIEMLAASIFLSRKKETREYMKKHEGAWEEGAFDWNSQ